MTDIRALAVAALAVTLAAAPTASSTPQTPRQDTSIDAVVRAAGAYLQEYQKQLTFVLADERYTQRVLVGRGRERERRVMTGELFVTFVPGDQFWISVHDVAEVDGQPIPDREDFRQMLERNTVGSVARTLMQRNARFNVGTVRRNFNEPTLGLRVLESTRRHAMKFSRKHVANEDGVTLVTVGFKEAKAPALVRGDDGSQLFSTGEVVVEAATGRIRHTRIELKYQSITAELETTFAPDAKLDLWVPVTFSERYERDDGTGELILCDAEYTNFRRFEARYRIR